jgi:hypothetical protein
MTEIAHGFVTSNGIRTHCAETRTGELALMCPWPRIVALLASSA